jgi:uncharacterized protein (DUF169 family)
MENMQELARLYRRLLQLKSNPVAVKLFKDQEEVPVEIPKPETVLPSFCHGIMAAFKGKSYLLRRGDVRCDLGLSALGFKKESQKAGKQKPSLQNVGFGNEAAAQRALSKNICLPAGQTKAIALGPLEKSVMGVDVVLFKLNSEQAFWLLTANQYQTGERTDLSIGTGYQGVCGDIIVYPLLTRKVNLTVNGIGDRLSSSTAKNELFAGIPASLVKPIADNLTAISQKPNFKHLHTLKGFKRPASLRNGPRP